MEGAASAQGEIGALSFDVRTMQRGMEQIYLDTLRDTKTRSPGIARLLESLRNARIYLLKESSRDMHESVALRDLPPVRSFVLHNAICGARDTAMAETAAASNLYPLIHIPELRRFRNLDVKEMMIHRGNRSPGYHTQLAGDRLHGDPAPILEFDSAGTKIGISTPLSSRAARRSRTAGSGDCPCRGGSPGGDPGHLRDALACQDAIEKRAYGAVLGDA
ncbi:MAG: hypothetical protein QMD46_07250 [Methanomicrobiales archaeon]|nr:hypothetical protein [Methanomicrobiales archaeon]MDI6876455.1 hypothetical protein [Methanomicrobiales archaeon]